MTDDTGQVIVTGEEFAYTPRPRATPERPGLNGRLRRAEAALARERESLPSARYKHSRAAEEFAECMSELRGRMWRVELECQRLGIPY